MGKQIKKSKTKKFILKFITGLQGRLDKFSMPEYTIFSVYAVITGAIVGLAAVIFHESITFFSDLFFDQEAATWNFLGGAIVIFIPAVGMLIQVLMIIGAPKTAKKRGVSEVIKAVATRGGYIPFRTTIFHFFAPAICMGSGGTVGPEGPAAQLGGGVASKFAQMLDLSDTRRRIFTAAGAGAAIAAVFNTPLGGVFFALEIVLLNDFQSATFSALILASVTSSAISRIFLGDHPAFIFSDPSVGSYEHFYLFAILGLAAGLISIAYINYSEIVHQLFKRKILSRIPRWQLMLIIGLLMGVCGYFFPGIFGIGYNTINKILADSLTWKIVLILFVMKFILVPLILHSGGFGGVFAPSLFMGATFGYLYALALNYFWGMNVDTTTYVLVSMGAVLGGINSIPISAILIIFEMTKDYSFILPLMLAVVLSTTIVQLVLKGSIHVKHLEQEGYHISSGREASILKSILVKDVMTSEIILIKEDTSLSKLINQLLNSPHNTFYTVNNDGILVGIITENELRPIITEYDTLREMIVARDIARSEVITVNESDDLEHVFKLFGNSNLDQFPVVSELNPNEVLGTIRRQDVINAYNKASLKYNITDGLASELKTLKKTTTSRVTDGFSIVEKKAPASFIGKTLVELKLRNIYGLEVLMIKQKQTFLEDSDEEIIIPDSKYKIMAEDTLVIFGADEKIKEIDNWS